MYNLLPLEEIKELLAERFDEVALLEALGINSWQLVERFEDLIEEDIDKYIDMLDVMHLEGYSGLYQEQD